MKDGRGIERKRMQPGKKHGGQPGNRGNLKPSAKFLKRNKATEKHGLFSKFLPNEKRENIDVMTELSAADLM